MAEGANIRQNLQNLPSIFDITAAETLDSLIYPALSKLFDFFHLRLDFKLGGKWRVNEELSPVLAWALQYLYLRKRNASFGESFYGLQRSDIDSGEDPSRQQQWLSASMLTLLPYLERKLQSRSARHEGNSMLERQLVNMLHAYHASKSIHTFLYLIRHTITHSPIFRALGLTLTYPSEPPKEDKTTYIFLKALEVMAFFLQFIQWWYSNDQRRKMGGTLKNPEAMEPHEVPEELKGQEVPRGHCPVCLLELETPTACAVSGYVYCWKCIVKHLKEKSSCPVTGHAITLEDLIRIYES